MKKEHIARRLARESRISTAAAADQLDRIMSDILKRIRRGKPASIPGLGTFRAGWGRDFKFEGAAPNLDRQTIAKKVPR
jgi:nucleoid DNA-binding protein